MSTVSSCTNEQLRALETVVTQWKKVEQSLPRDTGEPHAICGAIVLEWKLMESSVHSFTVQPHGTQEIIVVQWNLKETGSNVNLLPIKEDFTKGSNCKILAQGCHFG